MSLKIENAKITGTMLGFEDHGIVTAFVYLEWAGGGVGFGGYCLDTYSAAEKKRIGTRFGTEFIMRTLETIGVSRWEELKGKYCRVETGGPGSRATRIGHITENQWFTPETLAETLKDA